jgi:beta-galactosidase
MGWRMKRVPDPYPDNLPELQLNYDDSAWDAVDVDGETGALGLRERAVYRTWVTLTAEDLQAPAIELGFNRIAGGITVFVNGQRLGGVIDLRAPTIRDVKALLHLGRNLIVVPTADYGTGPSGLSRGAFLRFQEGAAPVQWQRSAFNGWAQVIVQSSKEPGELRLTARAPGLALASLVLPARPATPRPAVP